MVTFEQEGREVGFQQGVTRLEWRPSRRFILGADLPVSSALTDSRHAYGFSNPMLFAQAAAIIRNGANLSFGGQCELPYGDVSGGFASNHAMGVAYGAANGSIGNTSVAIRMGLSTAIPYHVSRSTDVSPYGHPLGSTTLAAKIAHAKHEHAGSTSFIEPHSDRDLLFGIEGSRRLRIGTAALNMNWAHAMESGYLPENAISGGVSFEVPFGERLSIRPEVRFPLMYPARFESAGGIGIRNSF
jgi:hypothetical protein